MVESRRLDERAEFLERALERWRADWESLDTDRYLAHYSADFSAQNADLDGWSRHKRMVNSGKTWIKVKVAISACSRPGQGRPGIGDLRSGIPVEQSFEHRQKAPVLAARGKRLADHLRGDSMKLLANVVRATALAVLLTGASSAFAESPRVEFKTTMGGFTLELYPDKAPKTVENFLQYANSGFYKGTVFHRVIDGFMIQGGGFDASMRQKETRAAIENEAGMAIKGGLKNEIGTIAMARTSIPNSGRPSSSST